MLRFFGLLLILTLAKICFAQDARVVGHLETEGYLSGDSQVRKMLDDRIHMAVYPTLSGKWQSITEKDTVFVWMASRFGAKSNTVIVWNPDQPLGQASADNHKPNQTEAGYIRIRSTYSEGRFRGDYRPFEELWCSAFFEMCSLDLTPRWYALFEAASKRQITRTDYIREAAHIEYDATQATRKCYTDVWLPWAKSAGFKSNADIWYPALPGTFEKWFDAFKDQDAYPYKTFGDGYDFLTGKAPMGETE